MYGQTHVALSRCVSLDGIRLNKEIKPEHIIVNKRVVEFYIILKIVKGNMYKKTKQLLSELFLEEELNKLDFNSNTDKKFIIERIIQYGWIRHVNWMLKKFRKPEIVATVKRSKNIDKKTANFWSIHFKIPKSEIINYKNLPVLENTYDPFFKFNKNFI